jgi:predicted PhzF superfamily epimerase YddE/YHI9
VTEIWLVDAFADAEFRGNPAGVVLCPDGLPPADRMQDAARAAGLPTLAFLHRRAEDRWRVRWFTPGKELNICGHATVASACYLHEAGGVDDALPLVFETGAGELYTRRVDGGFAIDLPVMRTVPVTPPPGLEAALGVELTACERAEDDILVEVGSVDDVASLKPDFAALAAIDCRGHVVTARGGGADFVSRTFFPALGVDEDQVCVSAHCKLAPYWAERTGRETMSALQLSERGGRLSVTLAGDRVLVAGPAVVRGRLDDLP